MLRYRQYIHVHLSKLTDTHNNNDHGQMMHFDYAYALLNRFRRFLK